ncbi:MAG TPA: glycine oxidase ThiO [Pyrinomonadaceae bacterium]|nr:glycine oxidase ThiO [Pyrinomonadaceae bacterium]
MRKSDERGAADVAVVGGGVAGLSIARELARRGFGVIVIEGGAAGAGASGAAAGMLAPQSEADCADELFELLCASRDMYTAFAASLLEESGVDVELERTGTLYLAFTEEDEHEVERRFAWQSRAGLEVERLTAAEARELEPQISMRASSALRFPRDWQVENRRLVRALAKSAARFGARVLTETHVGGVRVSRGRACGVETSQGFVAAGAVVLAAGARTSRVPLITQESEGGERRASIAEHPRVEPVRGQMLCFEQTPSTRPFVRHVVYSPRGYIVPRRDGRLLAGSTSELAGFDCSVTADGIAHITSNALEIAPRIAALELSDSWAGLRPRASDDWPVLGESPDVKSLFYATGHYRNGILLAPATGEIVADLVVGGTSRIVPHALSAFSPARFRRALVGASGN